MSLSRRNLVQLPFFMAGAAALGLGAAAPALAETPEGDAHEVIDLWPHPPSGALHSDMPEINEQSSTSPNYSSRRMKGITRPRMKVFPAQQPNGSAMLIIPGGGFEWNYYEHEGVYIANILNRAGITCFVLFYRLALDGWGDPASVGPADAQRAMRVIRANAQRLQLDPARVGVMGFSAGGLAPAPPTGGSATILSVPIGRRSLRAGFPTMPI